MRDLGFGNGLLDRTSRAQATKEKLEKLDLIKIKTFLHY